VINLTKEDLQDLKHQGFSDDEIQKAIVELEQEGLERGYEDIKGNKMSDPRQFAQHSSFATRTDENLIRWQLELNDILERSEHVLKGDIVEFKNGQLVWSKNPDPKNNCLNDVGVQLIMKTISSYINRNTILSDYTNDEINFKVYDFGREINNLIFMKYEIIGMDTEEKRKEYPMLVREIVDLVHSAYKRALMGGERRSLREMISVTQSSQTGGFGMNGQAMAGNPQQKRGILNPARYLIGKYSG